MICFIVLFFSVMAMLNIVSLNCNGLSDMKKLNCIFALCKENYYDVVCLQETFWYDSLVEKIKKDTVLWDGDIFYSNDDNHRRGVAILISKRFKNTFSQIESNSGRFLYIKGVVNEKTINIYNIYAPNNINERVAFFEQFKERICDENYILIAGDFNTTLSSLDRSSRTIHSNDKAVKTLHSFMEDKNLFDIWRNRNVNSKMFSRKQMVQGFLTQSRIDYFLVSNELKAMVKNIFYRDTSFSDHSIVYMSVDFSDVEKGPGVWIFNNSFLEDNIFVEKIRKLFADEIGSDFYNSNPLVWWDNLKFKVRRICQIYGKERQKEKNREYFKLQNKLQELSIKSANGFVIDNVKYLELKSELELYEKYKCQGAILRSKSQWALESDRNTSYFLKLEKYRQNKNVISEIKNKDGVIVTETNDILDVIHDYYKELFSCVQIEMTAVDELLSNINIQIDDDDLQMCDDVITLEEIEKSVNGMKKNKTPGPDGITLEFYLYFFNDLKHVLHYIYESVEDNEELSRSMKYGLINLIYKNKGCKSELKNFRPISLLNVDYKILARIMANRLKFVLPKIISSTQSCCIIGKDISDTVCNIRDIMDLVELDDIEGFLLKLDQEKAFDRAGHEYLFEVLKKFGFGNKFIKWIRIFYTNIFSSVKCNGFLTPYFRLKNSVKQGCPISALLYVLLAEPLSTAIKKNNDIKGIKIPMTDKEEKIFSHADDTTLTLADKNSIQETFKVIKLYEKASGAKLNKDKSEVMSLGSGKICQNDLDNWQIKECKEVIQILGVWIGKNKKMCSELNWECKVQAITKILNFWKLRNLTIHGRVSVISSLLMSKLWYTLTVVNIPEKYYLLIKNKCLDFLWKGKPPLVAYDVIIKPILEGGLNFPDILQKMYAFRLKFISRLLDSEYEAIWKSTCIYFFSQIENMKLSFEIFLCKLKDKYLENIPEFYQSMLISWQKIFKDIEIDIDSQNIFDVPLFLNPNICYHGKMLFFKTFIDAGVSKMCDIAFECKPGFLKRKYIVDVILEIFPDALPNKILEYIDMLLESIPEEYKILIQTNSHTYKDPKITPILNNGVKSCIFPSTTREFYRLLIEKISKDPVSLSFWRLMYPDLNIEKVQKSLNYSFLQSDCREVSFKVFNRIIFTKDKLYKCNITVDNECPICSTLEDLHHLIYTCRGLHTFNDFVKDFLHNIMLNSTHDFVNKLDFKYLCYFGLTSVCKNINVYFINNVLAIRRFCVIKRRNLAMKENKILDIEQYFKSILVKNINYAYEHYKRNNSLHLFEKYYHNNNPVIAIRDNQVVVYF